MKYRIDGANVKGGSANFVLSFLGNHAQLGWLLNNTLTLADFHLIFQIWSLFYITKIIQF